MDAVQDKHLFELIFDEISPATKNLLCIGHTGIVVSLSKGCERLASKQGQFTQVNITQLFLFKICYKLFCLDPSESAKLRR